MKIARIALGLLLAFVGAVWTLQGLGSAFVPQSFMTNSMWWVWIGLVTLVMGVAIVIRSLRKPD